MAANIVPTNANVVPAEEAKLRSSNRRMSSSGCRVRRAWTTKAAISSAPLIVATSTRGAPKPALPASDRP